MTIQPRRPGPRARVRARSAVLLVGLATAGLLVLPATAFGQTPSAGTPGPGTPTTVAGTPTAATGASATTAPGATSTAAPAATATSGQAATASAQPTATGQAAPSLSLSTGSGLANASITVNGVGFRAGETVSVTFNGQGVGSPSVTSGGTFSLSFTVPNLSAGQYAVLATGESSGLAATTSFTINAGGAGLSLSASQGATGTSLTVSGTGFRPGESVQVSFNGVVSGSATADTNGNVSVTFTVPSLGVGQYGVSATGQASGVSASTSFTINQGSASLSFSPSQATPGTALTVTGSGFRPGETVQMTFNGAAAGSGIADTNGDVSVTTTVPTLGAGQYDVTATGQTSGVATTSSVTVLESAATAVATALTATPAPAANATPSPTPNAAAAASAPAIVHDDRYFSQTGYRIDNDDVWAFFQQYGGLDTFGYPVSRQMTFLGCPVQMFQRQIIQDCPGQGAQLINMLDPDIFPYTQVNGSTFPAPDPTLKNNTPQVGSPTYAGDIAAFIAANVPDSSGGQPVNFQQTFNTLGGLTIWGAPISGPQPDPSNGNFIYQRFQRGIMHYIVGQGTESILLADYLKAIIMNQNVPPDLAAQASGSRFFNQYCPGQTGWLCRPNDLGGTDLTYAFVSG